jgi:hypothetical protein
MRTGKAVFLFLLLTGFYLLHQDSWNWKKHEPLLFGFLPPGLAYHVGYSIAASLVMAILVRVAWPRHLENVEPEQPRNPESSRAHE